MNRLTITALSAVLVLAMLSGCPGTPEPAETASVSDASLAVQDDTCETLPAADSAPLAASDSVVSKAESRPEPKPEPKPEPEPEPPPVPSVLPRMWDYGSEKCIPCKEMEKILTPMMSEYEGRVDIRIVNVYDERGLAAQAGIQVIPTQVFHDPDGNELFRHVGAYPRDSIVAKFREFGWE